MPRPETDTETLKALAKRIERNTPDHKHPDHFFEERSEIADALRKMAKRMGGQYAG